MSGGSYNYLAYAHDLDDLLQKQEELKQMADRLDGLTETEFPGAHAAAQMTRQLLVTIQLWESHIDATTKILGDVWKSVEWWDSCDWGPDAVKDALHKLLGGDPNADAAR